MFYFTYGSKGQSHPVYVQVRFPNLCRLWCNMFKCSELLCAFLMEKEYKYCRNYFDINYGRSYSNHWDLNGYMNIYIA